jgi:DMSO/TMAO reductase YedYZ heme-binding membrane subunit
MTWLPVVYLVLVAGMATAIVTTPETSAEEVRAVIRATAFSSSLPFLAAFVAAPFHALRPGPMSQWLMRHRRALGLSVAASHLCHLVAIVALMRAYPSTGEGISPLTMVFGGGGFVFLALMAATSNDASQRALGRGWGGLHRLGLYVVWLDFIFTYSGAATVSVFHAVMTGTFALAFVLRMLAWSARRA